MRKILIILSALIALVAAVFAAVVYSRNASAEFVSRADAIEGVLRAIGASDDVSGYYLGSSLEFYISDETENPIQNGFLYCAIANHIVLAEQADNRMYKIYPEDKITFCEVCQIMSACLQDKEQESKDAYTYCVKKGIIKLSDIIYGKNEYVSKDKFDIMLNRFLNCKRYKYFVFTPVSDFNNSTPQYGYGIWEIYHDEYRTMTYNEYFASEQYSTDRKYANE